MPDTNLITSEEQIEYEFVDLLNRENLAENFTKVILSQNAKVYSINAPWGAGKTYFLKFIEKSCRNHNIPFIQYNIWETDYLDNPLKSILNEFLNLILTLECNNYITDEIKELAQATKKCTSKFIECVRTFGFHFDWIIPTTDGTSSIQMGISKAPSENRDEYDKMKSLKEEIKKNLKKIISNIPSNKIVIAIDELDRCRPDYAIKTLEIIKHFFDIDKLVFILAIDKEQLKNTVKVLYGVKANTDCYLKKFVDIEYLLPKPDINNFIAYLVNDKHANIKNKFNEIKAENFILWKNRRNNWVFYNGMQDNYLEEQLLGVLKNYKNLQLRDIEKFLLKLSIIMSFFAKNDILCLAFLLDLIILNMNYPIIYNFIKEKAPADNYNNYEELKNLNRETFAIIKIIHSGGPYPDSQIYDCRNRLKEYFNKIDLAENFRI